MTDTESKRKRKSTGGNLGGGRMNLSGNRGEHSPILTMRLPRALWEEMDAFAAEHGVHRNQVVRAALDGFLHGRTDSPEPLAEYDIVAKAKAQRKAVLEKAQQERGTS